MLLNRSLCVTRYCQNILHQSNKRSLSIKVAVVGSGPAGFYTTQKLLRNPDTTVDIYEKLPVPFGLVRYGVAPDHADVKNVMNSFTSIANHDRVNFYGNVSLGQSISLDDLIRSYHAVVLCYGSSQDKLLNIEGEATSRNTISSRNFVGWYNGLPEDKDLDVSLDCDTACIVGHGNVALDCARLLLRPANLEKTDITSYSQKMIASSKIRRIYIIGRRGPVQASFTTKELRELVKLNENYCRLEPESVCNMASLKDITRLPRQRRRLYELIHHLSSSTGHTRYIEDGRIECIFKFLAKPHRLIADEKTKLVTQLEIQRGVYNNAEDYLDPSSQPNYLDEYEKIDCGLVIRSIGYKALMVDSKIPQDRNKGAILNTCGRIHGYRSLYCSGWLATGPVGVIANTLDSSHITANSILEDINTGQLPNLKAERPGYKEIDKLLKHKKVQVVHFNDWLRIDELERRLGETLGKTREKFVDVSEMLQIASDKKQSIS